MFLKAVLNCFLHAVLFLCQPESVMGHAELVELYLGITPGGCVEISKSNWCYTVPSASQSLFPSFTTVATCHLILLVLFVLS